MGMRPQSKGRVFDRIVGINIAILLLSSLPCVSEAFSITTSHYNSDRRSSATVMRTMSGTAEGTEEKKRVVIAGAGIMGLTTAYYLQTQHASRIQSILLVDPSGGVAPAASGKAGGFLALDWNAGPLDSLARHSFQLHQALADALGASNIQYRRATAASVAASSHPSSSAVKPSGKKLHHIAEWVVPDQGRAQTLGDETTIAQVHPKLLCNSIWERLQSQNDLCPCTIIKGRVGSPVLDEHEILMGTTILMEGSSSDQEDSVECTDLLFATGPWCNPVVEHMMGVKYHSAIVPTPRVLTQSVFFSGCGDPEVYPRPDQTAYCTGFPDPPVVVSEVPGQEEVRPEAISQIIQSVRQATSSSASTDDDNDDDSMGVLSADPTLQQSCYLPTTPDNLPFMGKVSKNCFVAAGHGCWGILMGPATGEAMASLIATGKSTPQVNLQNFDPLRFTKGKNI